MKTDPMCLTTVPAVCIKFMEILKEKQKSEHVEEDLEHLKALLEHGIINKDEFEVMESRIGEKK